MGYAYGYVGRDHARRWRKGRRVCGMRFGKVFQFGSEFNRDGLYTADVPKITTGNRKNPDVDLGADHVLSLSLFSFLAFLSVSLGLSFSLTRTSMRRSLQWRKSSPSTLSRYLPVIAIIIMTIITQHRSAPSATLCFQNPRLTRSSA